MIKYESQEVRIRSVVLDCQIRTRSCKQFIAPLLIFLLSSKLHVKKEYNQRKEKKKAQNVGN